MRPKLNSAGLLGVCLLLLACGDQQLLTPAEPSFAKGPATGFPHVFLRQAAGPQTGAAGPVVRDLAEAVDRVGPGGVIHVDEGTYEASSVVINKPLSIEAWQVASPEFVKSETDLYNLIVREAGGTVSLRGLAMQAVRIIGAGHLEVEEVGFGATRGPQVSVSAGATAQVFGSTFTGGLAGVFAAGSAVDIQESQFFGAGLAAVYLSLSSGSVESSTFEDCGQLACVYLSRPKTVTVRGNQIVNDAPTNTRSGIWSDGGGVADAERDVLIQDNVVGGSGGLPRSNTTREYGHAALEVNRSPGGKHRLVGNQTEGGAYGVSIIQSANVHVEDNRLNRCILACATISNSREVVLTGNRIVSDASWFTPAGIMVSTGAGILIQMNVLEAAAVPSSPENLSSGFSMFSGIQVQSVSGDDPVVLSGNRISETWEAIHASFGGSIEGGDNVSEGSHIAVRAGQEAEITLNRNDFTGYALPFSLFPDALVELTCNWWGSVDGPVDPGSTSASIYTPWAGAPIAGTGSHGCD